MMDEIVKFKGGWDRRVRRFAAKILDKEIHWVEDGGKRDAERAVASPNCLQHQQTVVLWCRVQSERPLGMTRGYIGLDYR